MADALVATPTRPAAVPAPAPPVRSLGSCALQRCGPRPCSCSAQERERHARRPAGGGGLHRAARSPALPPAEPDWALVRRPLGEPGRPLDAAVATRLGSRLGHDFSGVRVHDGAAAAASARAVDAEAFTVGHHLVFDRGRYAPGSAAGERLLAHELTHVVQQAGQPIPPGPLPITAPDAPSEREAGKTAGGARALTGRTAGQLQRSPLSDDVRAVWAADPNVNTLLARLSRPDIQGVADADVDTELARILKGRANDLWVAQRIRRGELGTTTGQKGIAGFGTPMPVKVAFIRGTTPERALVIAGVHGSEQQGIEVAEMVLRDLAVAQPRLTVIVVPSLFPHAGAAGVREVEEKKGGTPTNRNFPPAVQDLAAAKAAGGGTAVDERGRRILAENVMLLELIERFKPSRIISIHGTRHAGAAGVSFDPRSLRPDEVAEAFKQSGFMPGLPFFANLAVRQHSATLVDRDLASKAAAQIDADTSAVAGRGGRDFRREKEKSISAGVKKRRAAHPSVAGNVGPSGALDDFTWSGGTPGGVSLGDYASKRGISIFTVEPPINARSGKYPGVEGKRVSKADRLIELKAYADAIRTVLLGQ